MLKKSLNTEFSWEKALLLLLVCLCITTIAFGDWAITRGPDIGEIYFIGPTVTGEGIYHSTDFGETATCMDSTLNTNINFMSIVADLTPGVLYGCTWLDNLYISYNYGQYGSWIYRSAVVSYHMSSGTNEGYLFSSIRKHSENYGSTFILHSCQGFFGNLLVSEIDTQSNIGYAILNKTGVLDSLYLMISYDNFNNLEVQHVFNFNSITPRLSQGHDSGEIFLLINDPVYDNGQKLFYSDDYGNTWEQKNTFNCPNLPIRSIVGGRQPGELYMVVEYIQLMHEIAHIYIYHSLDYGETFTVYHPFSHGTDPYVANFEASPINGTAPLTVQFTDLSTGENLNYWEWDFDNDGEIDSYEQNPEYTYQNTGYYSVELSLTPDQLYTAIRYNYIHVTDTVAVDEEVTFKPEIELKNYPNPITAKAEIYYSLPKNMREAVIEIYNIKGEQIEEIFINNNQSSIEWNAEGLASGIYFYRLNLKDSPIRKLIILR